MAANPIPNVVTKSSNLKSPKPKFGLRVWMERVLEECDRADKGFDADAVHDLRVSLRRCRSLADGLIPLDPDPSWKQMKKAGKKVFQALGELRDIQVMEEWVGKLSASNPEIDPVATKLLSHLTSRESEYKQLARKDLDQFDRKQWRQWSKKLPQRSSRVRPGSQVYLHLALEKWTAAYELHKRVLRTRSTVGWHELRIGIKHLRYTVENFVPQQHADWGNDLKELQDLLGEVHDLDVLWATAVDTNVSAFADIDSRNRWREKLTLERTKRISRYRDKMVGKQSLWREWRAELPQGVQLRAAALSRLKTWAGYVDPDFVHSQRASQLAILLFDRLKEMDLIAEGALQPPSERALPSRRLAGVRVAFKSGLDARSVLQAAAYMHDVGRAKGAKNLQKKSYRMIHRLDRPLGIEPREWELAAATVRYHRGSLPRPRGKAMQRVDLGDRPTAMLLAGILRLAVALTPRKSHDLHRPIAKQAIAAKVAVIHRQDDEARRVDVNLDNDLIILRVAGYSALDSCALGVAGARHLLETALKRAILVRPLRTLASRPSTRSSVRISQPDGNVSARSKEPSRAAKK